jgi:hypothetical protein
VKPLPLILLALLAACQNGLAQGFVDLDFESPNLTEYSPGGTVPATNAFPGWIVNAQYLFYDNVSLSGDAVSIIDTNSTYYTTPIQGKYYAILEPGNSPSSSQTISLGQTGTIPLGTKSITFWGNIGGLQITFAGQSLAFNEIGSAANYNIYGADVSALAGQTGELLFTLPPYVNDADLDNIQFSTQAVPEPGVFALSALGGGVFLAWRAKRRN